MRHLTSNARLPQDGEKLLQRIEDPASLGAHVTHINTIVRGGDLGQIHNLLLFRKSARHIGQPGAQAHRAILHRLIDEPLHLRQFLRSRCPNRDAAHGLLPHRVVTNQRRHIDGNPRLVDLVKKRRHIRPGTTAVSRDDRRHPHAQKILCRWNLADLLRVRVHVDESRCQHEARRINLLVRRSIRLTHRHDATALHPHASGKGVRACAIDDPPVRDPQIIIRCQSQRHQHQPNHQPKCFHHLIS